MLREEPLADTLFRRYAKIYDPEALKMYLYQNDDLLETSYLLLEKMESGWSEEIVREIKRGFGMRKEMSGDVKLLDEYTKLQMHVSSPEYEDIRSVDELLKRMTASDTTKANKIKNEYKVSDKRYFWIQVKAYIQVLISSLERLMSSHIHGRNSRNSR